MLKYSEQIIEDRACCVKTKAEARQGIPIRSAAEAECPDRLRRLQQLQTLLHGLLRFHAQGGIVIVGQRVGQHDHRIPGHAADVRHGLRRVHKPVRDDCRGRDAGFFR